MTLFVHPPDPALQGSYVTIGNFDGVHRGHQAMLERLVARARTAQRPPVVVTFDPHPLALLRAAGAPPGLTTIDHRIELLKRHGAQEVLVLSTTRELLQLTAAEFFQQVILGELGAAGLVEGPNFYFGKDRGGNITLLRQFCEEHKIDFHVIEPVTWNSQWVSSSAIRSLIIGGDITAAVELLGHPYQLTGTVVQGAQRGRTIGVPTANLGQIKTVLPPAGVYAGLATIAGTTYAAAINIGPNPTFADFNTKVEVHLIQFEGDLYGESLSVGLIDRLRDVRPFASVEELLDQVRLDIATARDLVLRREQPIAVPDPFFG